MTPAPEATAGTGTVGVDLGNLPSVPPGFDARAAVGLYLAQMTGDHCVRDSVTLWDPNRDALESLIAGADGAAGWLKEGTAWAGPLHGAVAVFDAEYVASGEGGAWVIRRGADQPYGVHLRRLVSDVGAEVWRTGDEIHVCSDPVWSRSPAP